MYMVDRLNNMIWKLWDFDWEEVLKLCPCRVVLNYEIIVLS